MFFPVFLLIALVVINPTNAARVLIPSSDTSCTVKYDGRLLNEGEKVDIYGKLYKIEGCQLQRAYQACGTHLWFMINIVCGAVQPMQEKNTIETHVRRSVRPKLLTETCCESLCTVSEMARYCPE